MASKKLYKTLNITPCRSELITLVGGGGKTTTMFKLAWELKALGKKVLVTTSTAIFTPSAGSYDKLILTESEEIFKGTGIWGPGSITVSGKGISKENKVIGHDKNYIEKEYEKGLYDYILVEGDGSKRRPVKAPDSHEPVIPQNSTKVVGVIGMDSLGEKICEETVHRPQIFMEITSSCLGDTITEKHLISLIESCRGLFKNSPCMAEKYVLLNKVENAERLNGACLIKKALKGKTDISGIILAAMKEEINYIKSWGD